MAVIPQFSAGAPASPRAPVLGGEQLTRVDNRAQSAALDGLSRRLASFGGELPGVPGNLGQASMQGMQALGAGVKQVGDVLQHLAEKKAEAKNYADIHAATMAMEREAGDFARWREENPSPERWEEELGERLARMPTALYDGRELAPAAREVIDRNLEAFSTRLQIQTGVEAVRATTKQAREAGMEGYARAGAEGDVETQISIAQHLGNEGWIPKDVAARMELAAIDAAEAKQIADGNAMIDTFLLYDDPDAALEVLAGMPLSDAERGFKEAEIKRKAAVRIAERNILDSAYEDAFGFSDTIKRMEAKHPDGKPVHWPEVVGETRTKLLRELYREHHDERTAVVSDLVQKIESGGIATEEGLAAALVGMDATDAEKATLRARMAGVYLEDAVKAAELQSAISKYDPIEDPYGITQQALRDRALLEIIGSDRSGALLEELGRRANGERMTIAERIKNEAMSAHTQGVVDRGSFLIPADEVIALDGGVYGVPAEDAPDPKTVREHDPDWVVEKRSLGLRNRTLRRIELAQDDALKINRKDTKGNVSDLRTKEREIGAGRALREELDDAERRGEIKSLDEWQGRMKEVTREQAIANDRHFLELQSEGGQGSGLPTAGGPFEGSRLFRDDDLDADALDEDVRWLRNHSVSF